MDWVRDLDEHYHWYYIATTASPTAHEVSSSAQLLLDQSPGRDEELASPINSLLRSPPIVRAP